MMTGDSLEAGINEHPVTKHASRGLRELVFFKAGEDKAMGLNHIRTCHTVAHTLRSMGSRNAEHVLIILKSMKHVERVWEAYVDS